MTGFKLIGVTLLILVVFSQVFFAYNKGSRSREFIVGSVCLFAGYLLGSFIVAIGG